MNFTTLDNQEFVVGFPSLGSLRIKSRNLPGVLTDSRTRYKPKSCQTATFLLGDQIDDRPPKKEKHQVGFLYKLKLILLTNPMLSN
jgi:hypothetical protein